MRAPCGLRRARAGRWDADPGSGRDRSRHGVVEGGAGAVVGRGDLRPRGAGRPRDPARPRPGRPARWRRSARGAHRRALGAGAGGAGRDRLPGGTGSGSRGRSGAPEREAREAAQRGDEEAIAHAIARPFYPGAERDRAHAALTLGALRAAGRRRRRSARRVRGGGRGTGSGPLRGALLDSRSAGRLEGGAPWRRRRRAPPRSRPRAGPGRRSDDLAGAATRGGAVLGMGASLSLAETER